MIKLEHTETYGWEASIRGMRNPMNSWDKSDSFWGEVVFHIGKNDLDLMKRLAKAGSDHRKFMRMIIVSVDITAPLYWWKEFDTYKVGTVANSCSTMHKLHARDLTLSDFSYEWLDVWSRDLLEKVIDRINDARLGFRDGGNNKVDWYQMIQLLPTSYNQKRTVMMNYEVLRNMYYARKNHKLDEWHTFCNWIKTLPYAEGLIYESEKEQ